MRMKILPVVGGIMTLTAIAGAARESADLKYTGNGKNPANR
jgi:hypothetical protein